MNNHLKKIHFISIGGSVMHYLAIEIKKKGYIVTGSDDEIYDPAKTHLEENGLLPKEMGWFPEKITEDIEAVVLGMHAKKDNPELLKSQQLNLKIYSYPEYILEQSKNKQRIVIAGSHGKTTVTSLIMHILKESKRKFDYVVGALVPGFPSTTCLTDAPIIIIEGDEYLSSPIDTTPKFLHYKHHIGVITGIAWDHINVFPTFQSYKKQFELFYTMTPKSGTLIYNKEDNILHTLCSAHREYVKTIPYSIPKYGIKNEKFYLSYKEKEFPLKIFGEHNMSNIQAAYSVAKELFINDDDFYNAVSTFTGADKRLKLIAESQTKIVFLDYAHAPSKVEATVKAVKKLYPNRKLVACLELHTFSSLNTDFIPHYKKTLSKADEKIIFINPDVLKKRTSNDINEPFLRTCFEEPNLIFYTQISKCQDFLKSFAQANTNTVFLMMTSGNFHEINITAFGKELVTM
ncbi:MAG: Mur ligase family protein [Chitinophagaceae bacterium]|nr:Mur ligase family protein [Chitinophagaceae bacterium]